MSNPKLVRSRAKHLNVKGLNEGEFPAGSRVARYRSLGVCLVMIAASFWSLGSVAASEKSPDWESGPLEEIHVVETSRGSYGRPYYSVAGSRGNLHLFSDESGGTLKWTESLQLGGLMIDDTTYGEEVEWNSVDISVDPVRIVAGLRNSEVKVYDVDQNSLWPSSTDCGTGEVRAVAITPSADLVIAGSDHGPGSGSEPYLCGYDIDGNTIFEDYISTPASGYKITDIDIAESGKYITVTLAGPTSIVAMYDFDDRQYTGNDVFLDFPHEFVFIPPGQPGSREFKVYNEGGVTEKVVLTAFSPQVAAEFKLDGMTSGANPVEVKLGAGEAVHGDLYVTGGAGSGDLEVMATAYGDPNLPEGQDHVGLLWYSDPRSNEPPTAYIDSITPPVPVFPTEVTLLGTGVDTDGTVDYYRWTSDKDGLLCEGSSSTCKTDTLSVGAHAIYFHVLDDFGDWSVSDRGNLVMRSSSNPFPTEVFREENTDFTAGIAEISRDGRVVATSSLQWGGVDDTWSKEVVDTGGEGDIGLYTSMALDNSDNPHISYHDFTNVDLKYAEWTGSAWTYQRPNFGTRHRDGWGLWTSIAVADNGDTHIVHYDPLGKDLRYARRIGATWITGWVEYQDEVGQYSSIDLDSLGCLHVSYYDATSGDLKYAKKIAGPFQPETVPDPGDNVGKFTSIAVDTNNRPHISYYDETEGDLKYAKWTGSAWSIETVPDPGDNVGKYTSIDLDTNNRPHISYYDETEGDLKYAKWTGTTWSIETVPDPGDNVGKYTSIDLDTNNRPHISYYDETEGDLKYAKWTGTTWSIENVDSGSVDVGRYTSLALDSNGYPHVAYQDWLNTDLKYAEWTGDSWKIEIVDAGGDVGNFVSLALDSNDWPHIAYADKTNVQLTYAKWTGSHWQIESVAPMYTGEISLTLDGNDIPHISYYDGLADDLKYAKWTGTGWFVETVDSSGHRVGRASSIALDGSGYPHIGYFGDLTVRDLRYAKWTPASGWSTETVPDPYPISPSGTSLAFDSNYYPRIAYSGNGKADLKYAKWTPASGWSIETVDSNGACHYASLAIDVRDDPHISYSSLKPNYDLKYAYRVGSSWSFRTVDSDEEVGMWSSIALDRNNLPRISYYGITHGNLMYAKMSIPMTKVVAYYTENDWSNPDDDKPKWTYEFDDEPEVTTISLSEWGSFIFVGTYYYGDAEVFVFYKEPVDRDVGMHTSMDLDSLDNPHISYYDSDNGYLKYAKRAGNMWRIETVDYSDDVGQYGSIALDISDNPHISYYDSVGAYPGGDLKYAERTGAGWFIDTVDFGCDVGQYSSIALDGLDVPSIGYLDVSYSSLKYAKDYGDYWASEIPDPSGHVGGYVSLAIDDSNGNIYMSYYLGDYYRDLKLAKWTLSAGWTTETIDLVGNVGKYTSIALDTNGYPHISYYDETNGDLKYAKWTGSAWSIETVPDPGDNVGKYTSIALDTNDHPHISYYDETLGDLRYAYHNGVNWVTEPIDEDGVVGLYTSVALEIPSGYPHISYYDSTKTALKYSKKTASGWTTEMVDSGDVGHVITSFVPYSMAVPGWIWSSDFDGIGIGYPDSEDGVLILGTSSDAVSTHYNFFRYDWSDDRPTGYGHETLEWYHKTTDGPDIPAVSIATGDAEPYPGTPDCMGAIFIGTRWGATNKAYYWKVPP